MGDSAVHRRGATGVHDIRPSQLHGDLPTLASHASVATGKDLNPNKVRGFVATRFWINSNGSDDFRMRQVVNQTLARVARRIGTPEEDAQIHETPEEAAVQEEKNRRIAKRRREMTALKRIIAPYFPLPTIADDDIE